MYKLHSEFRFTALLLQLYNESKNLFKDCSNAGVVLEEKMNFERIYTLIESLFFSSANNAKFSVLYCVNK